jgi:hypothetical protein
MRVELRGALSVAVTAVALAGCAPPGPGPDGVAPRAAGTVVEVSNRNFLDVNVYVIRSGLRERLGTVRSMSTRTRDLPLSAAAGGGRIQLMAAPIGSQWAHLTETILFRSGDRIVLTVENSLSMSHFSVRAR